MLETLIIVGLESLIEFFTLFYGISIFSNLNITADKLRVSLYIIFSLVITIVAYIFSKKGFIVISTILFYMISLNIFSGSFKEKSKYSIFIFVLTGILDAFLSLLCQFILHIAHIDIPSDFSWFANYFIIFLIFTLVKYIKNSRAKNITPVLNNSYIVLICEIIFICSFCFFFISYWYNGDTSKRLNATFVISTFTVCILLIITSIIFIRTDQKNKYYIRENMMQSKLMEIQKNQYSNTLENYNEFRKLRHDYRGHLIYISHLASENKTENLGKYIKNLIDKYELTDNNIHVQNEAADCMINYFAKEAKQKNINFACEGNFRNEIQMTAMQICTCFYNLLKNAIEACEKITDGEKSIKIEIKSYHETLLITFTNTVAEQVDKTFWATDASSKPDTAMHGLGLLNVKNVIDDLHGQINFKNIEKTFVAELVIPPVTPDTATKNILENLNIENTYNNDLLANAINTDSGSLITNSASADNSSLLANCSKPR